MNTGTILLIILLILMGIFVASVYISFRKSKLQLEEDDPFKE